MRIVRTILAVAAVATAMQSGCADSDDPQAGAGAGSEAPEGEGICLMNNCKADDDCGGCDDDRNRCLVEESRCIACDPNTGQGCQEGYVCSSWGICAPDGQTCDTDELGTPTFECAVDDDCLACSPMHQVCDPATKRCSACTTSDTSHCLEADVCIDGQCSAKCPEACNTDADCGQCVLGGKAAQACNAHRCAECSETVPCADGLSCVSGSCVPQCGVPGPTSGECLSDADCASCGDPSQPGSWECKKPINQNGPDDRGTCGPNAAGCSDLGTSVAVLPAPWDQVTNTCSSDANCSGVGITYNVGKLIRDLVGDDEIDLGFATVEIKDANVFYDMGECADIALTDSLSCGVCVPCKVDSDCQPIAVDPLLGQLFSGQPFAQLAGSLLIDLLYGNNPNHDLNFQCQPVALGYGVCAPCANPLQPCGQSQGNQGSGSCAHGPCETGDALSSSCDSCAASVCQYDPYCCTTAWDQTCVNEVSQYCGSTTCSGGGGCAHSECTTGDKLTAQCSSCAAAVCAQDPFCCNNSWDNYCVQAAESETSCGC